MLEWVKHLATIKLWRIRQRQVRGLSRVLRFPLLTGASVIVGGYFSTLILTDREQTPEYYPNDLKATFVRRLPLNAVSKVFSWIADCRIPTVLRPYVLKTYAKIFGCDLTELKNTDLTSYSTVSEFFVRQLADGTRPINTAAALISPADGQILHFGAIDPEHPVLEQVKGVNYSLNEFLGPTRLPETDESAAPRRSASSELCLYQCVIYLGPGDCHRFFSPTDWIANVRRHFPGKLISVHPHCASRYPGLYTLNERVVYLGQWLYGFMSFGAVAAVGVGGIRIRSDPFLTTNDRRHRKLRTRPHGSSLTPYNELPFQTPSPLDLHKGDEFGYFTFGSTIVLVFEAPSTARWCIQPGNRVRIGQALLTVP